MGIMRAYRDNGILMHLPDDSDPLSVAVDYCDTVNSNIELFLKDKSRKMEVNLETINSDFQKFWVFMGAEGDINSALRELKTYHNYFM